MTREEMNHPERVQLIIDNPEGLFLYRGTYINEISKDVPGKFWYIFRVVEINRYNTGFTGTDLSGSSEYDLADINREWDMEFEFLDKADALTIIDKETHPEYFL